MITSICLFIACLIWAYCLESIAHYFITSHLYTPLLNCSRVDVVLRILCACTMYGACVTNVNQTPLLLVYLSALWVTIQTDLRHMLISRYVSLYLIPFGYAAAAGQFISINIYDSIVTSGLCYLFLWGINALFKKIKNHDGLGQGDIELLAFVGAWTGMIGAWFTVFVGSVVGSLASCLYMLCTGHTLRMIPFGPFLALGSMIFIFCQPHIIELLLTTMSV